jgi:hypothetical protein
MSRLPLRNDQGCALGIVADTYLEWVFQAKDIDDVKEKFRASHPDHKFIRNGKSKNIGKNVDQIHDLWTAVYDGLQVAGKDNKAAEEFDEAQKVLEPLW